MACHARRGGDHVLLGDPALEEAIRVGELERPGAAVGRQVGVEHDEVGTLGPQLEQRLAVGLDDVLRRSRRLRLRAGAGAGLGLSFEAGGRRLGLEGLEYGRVEAEMRRSRSARRASSSATARANGSSAGAPACQRYVPPPSASAAGCSMNETPFPFTVCATSAFGASPPVRKRPKAAPQRGVVVAVRRLDLPAERAELRLEVAERDDLLGRLVGLDIVAVDNDPEPAEPLVCGRLQRLPVLPLLELPVPRHHDDEPLAAEAALRERDAAALGDAHPERPRAGLDSGHPDVRVPVEPVEAAEAKQALARDDAEREEGCVQARHVVTLGRKKTSRSGSSNPRSATSSSSNRSCATMSSALNVEPRWPEPARFTATSAFSRHASARSASLTSALLGILYAATTEPIVSGI